MAGPSDAPNGRQGAVNELVRSRTDPDAGLVKRDGVPLAFYYKAHVGVDGGRPRLITAVEVTSGEVADEHLLDRLLEEHAGATGRTVTEVVADTKYGTHENYAALERQGILASIPPHSMTSDRGAYSADRFVYEVGADRFRCPAGQALTRQGSSRTAGAAGGLIYRARRERRWAGTRSRNPSSSGRRSVRAAPDGQHCALAGQAPQTFGRAR